MAKPIVLLVENDPGVREILLADLRRQYGDRFQVLSADSGPGALGVLDELQQREEPVALLLVERNLGAVSGAEFIEQATRFVPEARRILLSAGVDNGTVRISDVERIDYTLADSTGACEEYLYPVLDDLLADWHVPPVKRPLGLRVIGQHWSSKAHAIRDFLTRNEVAYKWVDVEDPSSGEVGTVMTSHGRKLPLVMLADGAILEDPSIAHLAERIGLQTHCVQSFYDLIVVGGGPAGLAAGVYAASEGLRVVIIEREAPGGQASHSPLIANYLGFPTGVPGPELAARAVTQATRFTAEIVAPLEVTGVRVEGNQRVVTLSDGSERHCRALLIAIGVSWRTLDVPDIDRFNGVGVYYGGGLAEARFCRYADVYIVGGANSAGQAALHFARYAGHVGLLVRDASLAASMSQYLIRQIEQTENITVYLNTEVRAVQGERKLEAITVENTVTGQRWTIRTNWLVICIGSTPRTGWLADLLELADDGAIVTARDLLHNGRPQGWGQDRAPYPLETNVPGVFAAGDVRQGAVKRVATAVGTGAMAVQVIHHYLNSV